MSGHKHKVLQTRLHLADEAHVMVQKRKADSAREDRASKNAPDTSKPSAIFAPTHGRDYTVSIALPGSIIANALTHDQKTALAGQVARACAVFCVDEIVVFDDGQVSRRPAEHDGYTAFADPNFFLYHLLSYLETPPHLRKRLFPMHPDLRTAGALPSVDMPHHLRSDEECPYREGIVTEADGGNGVYVDCGLEQRISVPVDLEVGTRLTVQLKKSGGSGQGIVEGVAVSPDEPREVAGYFWGYSVRQASSLSDVFTECPYDGGYDISIGTSERGISLATLTDSRSEAFLAPTWNHLLVVFGGVAGLEVAHSADSELLSAGVKEVSSVFDYWINLVPHQGSRTIRTEEAIWIGLTALRPLVDMRTAETGNRNS